MRIDTHCHFVPPELVNAARAGRALDGVVIQQHDGKQWMVHPQGYRYYLDPAFWQLDAKLSEMDQLGIDVSLLSLAPTVFFYWVEAAAGREYARMANEALAQVSAQSGGRILPLATAPMQDPEGAVAEVCYAVEKLGMRGVEVGTVVEGAPLDDPRFEPFWATVEELGVPAVLHPYYVGMSQRFADFYFTNLIGNPLSTTVAGARLILSGLLDRHPNLKIELVHAGGYLPYQIGRLDHGYEVRSETKVAAERPPSSYLGNFLFDTITHAATPLKGLIGIVGADRVVIGTDLCFDMADKKFVGYLDSLQLSEQDLRAINSDNAIRAFGLNAA